MADDLAWLDAIALRDLVADGQVTAAELAEGSLARIDAALVANETLELAD